MNAEVFTKPGCPYCVAAKQLLVKRNIPFVERDITRRDHWEEITSRVPGFRTVPQVFLDGRHIGGFDDLTLYFNRLADSTRPEGTAPARRSVGDRLGGFFKAGRSRPSR